MDNDVEWSKRNKLILDACRKEAMKQLEVVLSGGVEKRSICLIFVPKHSLSRVKRIIKSELIEIGVKVSDGSEATLIIHAS